MNVKATTLLLLVLLAQVLAGCAAIPLVPTATPTVIPSPTSDPRSAAKVVQAFWDALDAGDLEVAMTYVADDIKCAGYCYFTGKETFRTYLQGYLDTGFSTKISDLKNIGGLVTYSWEVYRNGLFLQRGEGDEVMEVKDNKIVYWENYHR